MALGRVLAASRGGVRRWMHLHRRPRTLDAGGARATKRTLHATRRRLSSQKAATPPPKQAPREVNLARCGATGVAAGGLGSLVGLGGGFVAVPMMTGWVGVPQHLATGTSLAVVLMTGSTGAYGYMTYGNIDYEVALAIALGGMVFARAGAKLMAATDATQLKLYMGMLQVGVSPLIPFKAWVVRGRQGAAGDVAPQRPSEAPTGAPTGASTGRHVAPADHALTEPAAKAFDAARFGKMFVVGSAAGFLAGMFGVGGGALTVPAIALATDLPQHAVVGTSLLAMLPPAIIGTFVNISNGNLSLTIAGPLALGSVAGATLGSLYLAPVLPETAMQLLFSLLMAGLGTRTVLTARAALRAASKA